jgi:hypothetical protein
MSLKQENNTTIKSNINVNTKRRTFLKKAAYATPTVFALGALMKPTESEAGFGKPPSGPVWQ